MEALLHAYEFGKLTPQEHEQLMDAALEHPEVFDQLWHAARHRELLQSAMVRQKLAAACLRPAAARPWVLLGRFAVPVAVAALGLFFAVRYLGDRNSPGGSAHVPAASVPRLSDAALLYASPVPAGAIPKLRLEDLPGGQLRLSVDLPPGATLYVLRIGAGREPEVIWPAGKASSLPAVLDKAGGAAGRSEVEFRVYVSPSGADLRRASSDPGLQMQMFRLRVP
ncbi:MAG: hypothetical protein K7J47_23785 [Acidobacteria bacterium]|nr:hypothetical protein [Bryobacteraceae bacterium CoA2 C42]